jgi:hypothetical protein
MRLIVSPLPGFVATVRSFQLAVLLGLTGFNAMPALASGQALKVRLVYTRVGDTSDCSEEEVLRSAVGLRLGFDAFSDTASTTVDVRVERKGRQLVSVVRVLEDGIPPLIRTLASSGKDCVELSEAMALAVALAIDPLAGAPRPAAAVPLPARAPAPARPPAQAQVAAPRETQEARLQWQFQMAVHGALGAQPGPTAGLALGGGLRFSRFLFLLEARGDLPGSLMLESGRVDGNLLLASALPCLQVGAFRGCLLVQAGVLRAAGDQLSDARRLVFPHVAVGVRAGLEWPSNGQWALVTHLDVAAPLTRVTLNVSDTPVWSSAALSGALAVGVLVRL